MLTFKAKYILRTITTGVLLLVASLSHARMDSSKPMGFGPNAASHSFQSVAYNPSEEARRTVVRELLGADTPALQWPAFPRIWYQAEQGDTQDTNTTYGGSFNVPGLPVTVGVTGKISINYSYSRKHYLVVMTSVRQSNAVAGGSPRVSENPLQDLNQITRFDSTTQRRFFNIQPNYPMIGFCAYEMQLKILRARDGSISFPAYSESINTGSYHTEMITLYSNFFQIEGHVPMMDYLNERCGGDFLKEARPFVENDFNKIVLEYYANFHPSNNCKLGGASSDAGDDSCMAWAEAFTDRVTRSRTVPRCRQQTDGTARCELFAKKNQSCPMYLQPDGSISERYQRYRDAVPTVGFRCDRGLKCNLDKNPVTLFDSLVVWPGSASCK
ncbi:MAG: hypothetical protein K2Q26_15005 [Bdellovibrionales bacterium]|nr:hypothetical protein [Bdellovibrionales bacterium]